PLLGICFGHQIIACAGGGTVARNPRGREIGTIEVQLLENDPLFEGLPKRFLANATHVDTVTQLPPGARLLAISTLDASAAYALGSARCLQFHPEIDGDFMRSLLEVRRPILEAEGFVVDSMIERVSDTPSGAVILRNFVRGLMASR
ncbi:MAG: gamma-glutamyl-gamma-aminobutyrate hydrolase family protein, partial [Polyangiaceae bacterium]|nr:gamma-glutamyl-gamma-aminobutyrate hydrolase family protein [Polyangiaceae bacterium]